MIINFSIQNFGCFKDRQTLSFEATKSKHLEDFYVTKIGKYRLLKIALIYGANASGKTTILKALDFLRNLVLKPVRLKTDELHFEPFLFDEKTPEKTSYLSIEFLQNKRKYFYEVEFNKKAIIKEILYFYNPNKARVFIRETDQLSETSKIFFGSKIKVDKDKKIVLESNTLQNNTTLAGYLKTNIEIEILKEVVDWFKNYLKPVVYPKIRLNSFITSLIDKGKIKRNLISLILKKADFNISNIMLDKIEEEIPEEILELLEKDKDLPEDIIEDIKDKRKVTRLELKFEHSVKDKRYILPFEMESEGTKRFYGFAGLLYLLIKDNVILPIDELESSLHPALYQHFLLSFLANSQNSQIIATTHNREILNDRDMIRDDALWITDKTDNDSTELYSFADFDTSVIRDTTNRLNAYKSGKLGGIPNISDYYLDLE